MVLFKKVVCTAILGVVCSISYASDLQNKMVADLGFVTNIFASSYAPAAWKQDYNNWNLTVQHESAKNKILNNPDIKIADYQQILKDFLTSTQDYHVWYQIYSTEKAKLDFTVRTVNNKFFIAYIDRTKLPETAFPFNVGDELVAIDNQPVLNEVNKIRAELSYNIDATDTELAALHLTGRFKSMLMMVPKGPVLISVKPQGSTQVVSRQLIWDYTPELINVHEPKASLLPKAGNTNQGAKLSNIGILNRNMISPRAMLLKADNPHGIGNRDSYIPELGTKIWESDANDYFQAYIYKHQNNKLIGYVRISRYWVEDYTGYVNEFAKIINKFEKTTDALVVDQLNNPGGSIFYMYTLASMLTTQPLQNPRHEMTLTPDMINEAYGLLDMFKNITTDEEVKQVFGYADMAGYPVSMEFVKFIRSYAQFMIDEWNQGKRLTSPYHIYGVDQINPSAVAHYSKPILLLVNALDFSCGDFFPSIMQDNHRAKIMGARTAGAGGYVLQMNYPNIFGTSEFSYTGSIAERVNKQRLENLGVTPDVVVNHTEDDFTNNYADYIKAVNDEVSKCFE